MWIKREKNKTLQAIQKEFPDFLNQVYQHKVLDVLKSMLEVLVLCDSETKHISIVYKWGFVASLGFRSTKLLNILSRLKFIFKNNE
jgi:hypothetical protein